MPRKKPNTLFPGRPDYTGPRAGMFGLLHHDKLCESSHDVMERVEYVKTQKPAKEIPTRLHNMIYLGSCPAAAKLALLFADYEAKRDALFADYRAKRDPLDADYMAKRDALNADYRAKRDPLFADYMAKRDPLDADYRAKRDPLDADYMAKRDALNAEIMTYIRKHIPDCAWDGKQLVFPE